MQYRDNLARKPQYRTNAEVRPIREVKYDRSKRYNLRLLQLANTLMVCTILGCAFVVITIYSNLTVLSKEADRLNTSLTKLESVQISLNSRVNNMFNLGFVEEYATNNLDMIKLGKTQIEYITIQNEDKIQVKEGVGSSVRSVADDAYQKIMEYIQ